MKTEGFEKAENLERFSEASFILRNLGIHKHYKILLTKNENHIKEKYIIL